MKPPFLSIVVVVYNMAREAPRTLYSLSTKYQTGIIPDDYEVIVVDNGSIEPLDPRSVTSSGPNFRLIRCSPAPSPAAAINAAVRQSRGDAIMICIDGARILSPGLLRWTLAAFRAFENPFVATLGWHLGPKLQHLSMSEGYDQTIEDQLLESVDWRRNGYLLFNIACLAQSSENGWFLPISESNTPAMLREAYERLGGLDENFRLPGGGLVNLDFYKRACGSLGELVLLLGEGTFHQFHGGVATNRSLGEPYLVNFHREYRDLRGEDFVQPSRLPHYLGTIPPQALRFLSHSAGCAHTAKPLESPE